MTHIGIMPVMVFIQPSVMTKMSSSEKLDSMRKYLAICLIIAIFMCQSCATNGYGCKGRAKEPTGTIGKKWKAL
jgi:hypothetical protein